MIPYLQPWLWCRLWLHQPHSAGQSCSSLCLLSLWFQLSGWSGHHMFQLEHDGLTPEWPGRKDIRTITYTANFYHSVKQKMKSQRRRHLGAVDCEEIKETLKPVGWKLTRSPFIHTTLGAGSPLMGISNRSLFPATIVTVLSGRFKLSKCTFGGSAKIKPDHKFKENQWKDVNQLRDIKAFSLPMMWTFAQRLCEYPSGTKV